jgi:hypothetical protein
MAVARAYLNSAVESLDVLYQAVATGHGAAVEVLRMESERLSVRADAWRQMNCPKK